ncbi:hypothetical protein MAUB_21150 [Mycolicibacterium aubagnense]|uniref:Uncharacterized protein n=1 Tax=Mycolicibacterium aubagnense TaxID=319707 RepID=A0ABN5YR67_9MYCO|nr:hypothetical protein MAUB_21150 [Mycolicibacterium aubagnense]
MRGPGRKSADRTGDEVAVDGRIQPGHHGVDDRDRIAVVAVRALRAAGPTGAIPGRDMPKLPAGRTRGRTHATGPAEPVLTTTLEGPHRRAALGADRRRNLCAGLSQGDQQVTDRPRRRRASIGQHRWALGKKRCQAPRFRSPTRDAGDDGPGPLECEPIIDRRDQVRDEPDRV